MTTPQQYLRAAYLLNDVGAAHHEHGQFDEAMQYYTQSLQLRGEAIDVAIARAQGNAAAAAGASARSAEEMEAYIGQLEEFVRTADMHQGPGAEVVRIRADEEAQEEMASTRGGEYRTKFFQLPMRIVPPPPSASASSWLNAAADTRRAVWTTVAATHGPPGQDASSVTFHNMSLLHLRSGDYERALRLSSMAEDALEEGGTDDTTNLCRAVILSNRGLMLEKCAGEEASAAVAKEKFEEAFKSALRSDQFGCAEAEEVAADVILNGVAVFLRDSDAFYAEGEGEDRIDDAMELCSHVCQIFPPESSPAAATSSSSSSSSNREDAASTPSRSSASSTPSSSSGRRRRVARRAHVLLAAALRAAGARLYRSDGLFCESDHLRAAQRPLARALHLQCALLGDAHPSTAGTSYLLGRVLHDREEYRDAQGMYERAMAAQREAVLSAASSGQQGSSLTREATDLLNTMTNLVKVHLVQGSLDSALSVCGRALEVSKSLLLLKNSNRQQQDRDDPCRLIMSEFVIVLLHMKGSICQEMGLAADAVGCFAEAVRAARQTVSEGAGAARRMPPLVDMRAIQGCDAVAAQGAAAA